MPPQRPPSRVYPPGTPGVHGLASIVAGVVVVCALYFGRAVLIPITMSVMLSFLLAPFVTMLRRLRMGQMPSIFIAVISSVAALLAVGTLIGAQLVQLASQLPQYQVAIEEKIETVQEKTVGRADAMLSRAATALARVSPERAAPPKPTGRAARNAPAVPMPVEVHEPSPTPMQLARRAFSPAIAPLETSFIVLVVTIFILAQREDLRDRLISLFGSRDLHRTTTAINDAAVRLSRYFVAQLAVNLSTGAVIGIGLAIIGVPGALLFGVCTALLRFVPYIGIWIAAALASILGAAIQPQWTMAVWTLILFGVVDVVAGQVAEPLLYGHRSGLSPLAVVVAAIFWGWLWGPIGLVLSTPLTLCVVTLGRYADRLNFLTVLLGDQPALTPAQNFYQRLLADDPHEAIIQAERFLRDMSLVDYYDKVAIEGLRLARNDALRGVLTADQLARINESLTDIVENLETLEGQPDELAAPMKKADKSDNKRHARDEDAQADAAAPPPLPVLCVPGRGAFDETTTAIAVQMLKRRGFSASALTYSDFRSSRENGPEVGRAAIVCIVTLDAPDAPPYLRNLLRRVRERRPDAMLVIGIGGAAENSNDVSGTDTALVAGSLRDLIAECLLEAMSPKVPASMAQMQPSLSRET